MGGDETAAAKAAMDGNTLSVMLFFVGLAAAFFIQTLRPEIQRVCMLMRITAATLLLIGIAWPFLGVFFPAFAVSGFAASVTSLASNAWSWFVLLMGTLLVTSLFPLLIQRQTNQFPPHSVATQLSSLLESSQIIFPDSLKNGVLWEGSPGVEVAGPFCPTHKGRLFFWPTYTERRAEFKEDEVLSGNASFVCPQDNEEFVFVRPVAMRVRDLRAKATEQFLVEYNRRKLLGE